MSPFYLFSIFVIVFHVSGNAVQGKGVLINGGEPHLIMVVFLVAGKVGIDENLNLSS